MYRALIGGIAAVMIAAVTAAANYVATSRLETRIVSEAKKRVLAAQDLFVQNASLAGLYLKQDVEAMSRNDELLEALKVDVARDKEAIANREFRSFLASLSEDKPRPDFLALVDKAGDLVALLDVASPAPDSWKDARGQVVYPSVALALSNRQTTSDILYYKQLKSLMKIGVAPIVDDVDEVVGALVIAYSLTAEEARSQRELMGGLDVAYFHGDAVQVTTFADSKGKEDIRKKNALTSPLFDGGSDESLAKSALKRGLADEVLSIELGGEQYMFTAGRFPRHSSKSLPADYPAYTSGAVVLMSLTNAMGPLSIVKGVIWMLGLGATLVAVFAILLTSRTILHPLDEIELGINEIINGNIDRTFRPAGSDLEGLANALNVMLARLLGRPEPGEEEYDDDGNIISTTEAMSFDTDGLSAKDAAAVNLAAESEPDYYKRTYDEYIVAKRGVGDNVEGVNYEGFVAKLRLTEANLKQKYSARAVRFKVVTGNGKVTLKPVPIS